ncbi:MAG: ABC transporter permease subunit [Gemmataceae bacterium]|nr:ABC transporter permease subunit [Gemmataceae bacterium]
MTNRRFFKPLLAALTLLCLAAGNPDRAAAQPDAAGKKPLRYGADAEGGAPYIFKDPADPTRYTGFEVDLAAALAKELDRPIEFRQYDYKNLVPGLDRGDFDFAMNGLEVTPDRKEKVLFSRPYYVFKLQLVVHASEARFDTLHGCKRVGGTVGTLEDTAASRLLEQMGIRTRLYDGQVEPYQDLAKGPPTAPIDAVLLDLPIATYYVQKNPDLKDRLKFANPLSGRGYYALAFSKKNPELAHEVDAALGRLLRKGEMRRICQKWGIWNDSQEELMSPGEFAEPEGAVRVEFLRRYALLDSLALLLDGAWMTIRLTALSVLLAVALGLPLALMRLYGPAPLRWFALSYVEFFRGIPVLLLLVFLYFGLPAVSSHYDLGFALDLDAFTAGVLAFGMNYAAYEAEIYRAGISSIPAGQWEAAQSLGMPSGLTFRRIILPQALRVIVPPMTNDLVALFKDTSVVSVIAVVELTKQYQILAKSSGEYLTIGLLTAGLYLVMSIPLGHLSRYLEARWGAKE